jgi:DNA-binding LytR/AlgR family response regulator
MEHLQTPQVYGATNQVYRSGRRILRASVPDLLVRHKLNYQAISSDSILYFTKNGNAVKIYCIDKRSYTIDITISLLWPKLNHRSLFRRISEHLIVNSEHIVSINRNGRKLMFLRNGDEIALDENLFSEIINSVIVL